MSHRKHAADLNAAANANGVLLFDKPTGLSSYRALKQVAHLISAKKAGHTGTLDPMASGLLPLCFGEATKFSHALLNATKCYEATLALGISTTTGDVEGEVLQTQPVNFDIRAVQQALSHFRGDILQVPPMYSALKHKGRCLYEYARAGHTLERQARPITLYELELIEASPNLYPPSVATFENPASNPSNNHNNNNGNGNSSITLHIKCSKGTYVRSLAHDIGETLGCGAHLTALRRTAVGSFTLDHAITLAALKHAHQATRRQWLQPIDALLSSCRRVQLDAEFSRRFKHGQRLRLSAELALTLSALSSPLLPPPIRVYDEASQFLGTAKFIEGILIPDRLICIASGPVDTATKEDNEP